MTNKDLYREFGNIDPDMIEAAAPVEKSQRKKRSALIKYITIAASFSLIVIAGIFGIIYRSPDMPGTPGIPDTLENKITSYFIITAHAANGESTQLNVTDSCLNSGEPKHNIFGNNMPTFNFTVQPSDLKSNEAIYERFDISISYNETVVEWNKDEHIMVAYLVSTQHSDEPWAYSIIGWFTEPTDIVINILDKESREIVETITLNVKYLEDKQEYELKVTDLTTKFSEQKEAVEAHNYLMFHLLAKHGTDYPKWFGGCYIEKNKLYIKLVSPSDEEMKTISDTLAHFGDVVVYTSAETSMTDLQEYADKTANNLRENGYAVTSWYVDSVTGDIIISVLEEDLEAVTKWVNTTLQNGNAPKIVIEIGEYTDVSDPVIEFCADPFLQQIGLSWMYSINVRIDNEKIYLNDILYDQISYVDNLDPDFSQLAPGPYVNTNISEELDKIKSQKGCYLLETQGETKFGEKIAMYIIGDTYYFIRFFDNGDVMRVHSGTVQ